MFTVQTFILALQLLTISVSAVLEFSGMRLYVESLFLSEESAVHGQFSVLDCTSSLFCLFH